MVPQPSAAMRQAQSLMAIQRQTVVLPALATRAFHMPPSAKPSHRRVIALPMRRFASNKDESDDYSKKFEDLLGKTAKPLTEQEKAEIERQKAEKAAMDAAASAASEKRKEEQAQQSKEDFEDLLSGKKQDDSEKNLQQLFKEFYDQAKQVEVKDYMNSARNSVGSLSGKLEQRRQKMMKMKQDAFDIDKDKAASATPKEEAKTDTTKD